jgi:predicted nucleic acid-binding OB-fold protein
MVKEYFEKQHVLDYLSDKQVEYDGYGDTEIATAIGELRFELSQLISDITITNKGE